MMRFLLKVVTNSDFFKIRTKKNFIRPMYHYKNISPLAVLMTQMAGVLFNVRAEAEEIDGDRYITIEHEGL